MTAHVSFVAKMLGVIQMIKNNMGNKYVDHRTPKQKSIDRELFQLKFSVDEAWDELMPKLRRAAIEALKMQSVK